MLNKITCSYLLFISGEQHFNICKRESTGFLKKCLQGLSKIFYGDFWTVYSWQQNHMFLTRACHISSHVGGDTVEKIKLDLLQKLFYCHRNDWRRCQITIPFNSLTESHLISIYINVNVICQMSTLDASVACRNVAYIISGCFPNPNQSINMVLSQHEFED